MDYRPVNEVQFIIQSVSDHHMCELDTTPNDTFVLPHNNIGEAVMYGNLVMHIRERSHDVPEANCAFSHVYTSPQGSTQPSPLL